MIGIGFKKQHSEETKSVELPCIFFICILSVTLRSGGNIQYGCIDVVTRTTESIITISCEVPAGIGANYYIVVDFAPSNTVLMTVQSNPASNSVSHLPPTFERCSLRVVRFLS